MLLLLMNTYNFGPTREPEHRADLELVESGVFMEIESAD